MSASLVADFLGPSSVPVILAGFVYGVFEVGERLASQRAKDALAQWLLTFQVQKLAALPEGTREMFEYIFGERHFSLKCVVRSIVFSIGAMAFVAFLVYLISPPRFHEAFRVFLSGRSRADDLPYLGLSFASSNVDIVIWLIWSFFVDYLSLFKTRLVLRVFGRLSKVRLPIALGILAVDYLSYALLFSVGVVLTWYSAIKIRPLMFEGVFTTVYFDDPGMLVDILLRVLSNSKLGFHIQMFVKNPTDTLLGIFFWAGFGPSIWLWLYVLTLFATRAILRSEAIVKWLQWFLDIEKSPFRSLGSVAAGIVFVVSGALLLIAAAVKI
jgi:hypothetical protein